MKILLVNKFHYLKGGSEKYYFELANLLKEKGHQIAFFSMKDERNIHTGDKEYFVKPIDLNSGSKLEAINVIYSKENKKKMEEALNDFKPDIVHINNFQRQLSASIIYAISKHNVPIVFTAHDLEAICPNKTMLDSNKEICEKCLHGSYINCIRKKCIKDSLLKSTLGALETKFYKQNNIYTKKIDFIITPSEFYRNKFIEYGVEKDKIEAIHNWIDINTEQSEVGDRKYALYFGRVSKEKGIFNLVKAFENINEGKLYIAGEGPDLEKLKNLVNEKNMQEKVKFLGFLQHDELNKYIRECSFAILPSVWYDNCPYSVLETLSLGKPVIGSNIAGIPELIKDGKNGLLFDYNNINDLQDKIKYLFNNEQIRTQMGTNARLDIQKNYNREKYYEKLIKIYDCVTGEKKDEKNIK